MIIRKKYRDTEWHDWYCWYPKWFKECFIWFEHIERRWNTNIRTPYSFGAWEYQLKEPSNEIR